MKTYQYGKYLFQNQMVLQYSVHYLIKKDKLCYSQLKKIGTLHNLHLLSITEITI